MFSLPVRRARAEHGEPRGQRVVRLAVLLERAKRQRRVVVQAVGDDLDQQILEILPLAPRQSLERDGEVPRDDVIHAPAAVLQHALHELGRGDALRLGELVREDHRSAQAQDVVAIPRRREKMLGASGDVVIQRHEHVLEVLDPPALERVEHDRPQLPHRGRHGRGVVGDVRANLQNFLVHVVPLLRQHLPQNRHQRRLYLSVQVRQRRYRLQYRRDRAQAPHARERAVHVVVVLVVLRVGQLPKRGGEILREAEGVRRDVLSKLFDDRLEREHQVLALDLVHELEKLVQELREDRFQLLDVLRRLHERPERGRGVNLHGELIVLQRGDDAAEEREKVGGVLELDLRVHPRAPARFRADVREWRREARRDVRHEHGLDLFLVPRRRLELILQRPDGVQRRAELGVRRRRGSVRARRLRAPREDLHHEPHHLGQVLF
mmetsp:Transcript_8895/g.32579  ORF Transcript_8895/g.32579 Transcript_8895/m.32579 type:complete len:436 (-) Transcript_8895:1272-2579(-)